MESESRTCCKEANIDIALLDNQRPIVHFCYYPSLKLEVLVTLTTLRKPGSILNNNKCDFYHAMCLS